MAQEEKNYKDPYGDPYTGDIKQDASNDPVEKLKRKAKEKLERLGGLPGMTDIVDAFRDRDEQGRPLTSVEVRKDYLDFVTRERVSGRSVFISMATEVSVEENGSFMTVALEYSKYRTPGMDRLWGILTEYGSERMHLSNAPDEVPVLSFFIVPLSLGGNYGMIAANPVFYCIQPSSATDDEYRQIRILFEPDGLQFVRDESFVSDDVIAQVKSEFATERLAKEAAEKKAAEEAEAKAEYEKEMAEYVGSRNFRQHTFSSLYNKEGEKEDS